MRPGQAAPEFCAMSLTRCIRLASFNEAGAGCPGIQCAPQYRRPPRFRFNEAGAGCPGIPTPVPSTMTTD